MATTSARVDKGKIEEAKAVLLSSYAREAIDKALDMVLALHHQRLVLAEMKANPMTDEHKRASVAPVY